MNQAQTARPANAIVHGECGEWWTGLRRAHCPACHRTFNSDSAAELHRKGTFGPDGDRRCVDPAEVGLVVVERPFGPCWQKPGSDYRFGRDDEDVAA